MNKVFASGHICKVQDNIDISFDSVGVPIILW